MTIRARHHGPNPLPIATMLAAIDTEGRETVNRARELGVPAFRAVEPAVSGRLRRGTVGRVARTLRGYSLTIAPTSRVRYPSGVTAAQVFRFVDRGTGVYGARGRVIRPRKAKAFALPGGWEARFVRGQHPQGIMARGEHAADPVITRELERGADRAAARAERAL
jgi:hypothetical protein